MAYDKENCGNVGRLLRVNSFYREVLLNSVTFCALKVGTTNFVKLTIKLGPFAKLQTIEIVIKFPFELLWFGHVVRGIQCSEIKGFNDYSEIGLEVKAQDSKDIKDLKESAKVIGQILSLVTFMDYLVAPQYLAEKVPESAEITITKVFSIQKPINIVFDTKILEINLNSTKSAQRVFRNAVIPKNNSVCMAMITVSNIFDFELTVLRHVNQLAEAYVDANKIFLNYCGPKNIFNERFDKLLAKVCSYQVHYNKTKFGLVCDWKLGKEN
ncbi:unnamed protein product [Bursaphelenchus okinawaensis]|uniref:Uncharacterized protein n=1 Tax=Bursaphelenchus okinawaensis TaxID=465554 RepID=A0A811KDK5_9BILA|nr:unnamed protein product [Bursaphelenchus okinawaensis]CAG9098379.1 unnamed protein product [Bursaphelenchus okinawaensis]